MHTKSVPPVCCIARRAANSLASDPEQTRKHTSKPAGIDSQSLYVYFRMAGCKYLVFVLRDEIWVFRAFTTRASQWPKWHTLFTRSK